MKDKIVEKMYKAKSGLYEIFIWLSATCLLVGVLGPFIQLLRWFGGSAFNKAWLITCLVLACVGAPILTMTLIVDKKTRVFYKFAYFTKDQLSRLYDTIIKQSAKDSAEEAFGDDDFIFRYVSNDFGAYLSGLCSDVRDGIVKIQVARRKGRLKNNYTNRIANMKLLPYILLQTFNFAVSSFFSITFIYLLATETLSDEAIVGFVMIVLPTLVGFILNLRIRSCIDNKSKTRIDKLITQEDIHEIVEKIIKKQQVQNDMKIEIFKREE